MVAPLDVRALLSRLRTDGSAGRDTEALRQNADLVRPSRTRAAHDLPASLVPQQPLLALPWLQLGV